MQGHQNGGVQQGSGYLEGRAGRWTDGCDTEVTQSFNTEGPDSGSLSSGPPGTLAGKTPRPPQTQETWSVPLNPVPVMGPAARPAGAAQRDPS